MFMGFFNSLSIRLPLAAIGGILYGLLTYYIVILLGLPSQLALFTALVVFFSTLPQDFSFSSQESIPPTIQELKEPLRSSFMKIVLFTIPHNGLENFTTTMIWPSSVFWSSYLSSSSLPWSPMG
jgi:hypothetical protein